MTAVDDVKARLDIVDVVGGYVRLQKAGRYFKSVCPFHQEKTPSFVVYPDRQSWHCFGACASGGDVIAFISKKENLDFAGALRLLAERAGVELQQDGPRREQLKTLQDVNEAAALYYHGLLQNNAAARAYVEERGLDRQAVNDFLLGYAPPGWDSLRGYLTGRGYDEAMLVQAGLLIEGERSPYDRFRHRLIIPIRDDRGRVVGFGGRILPGGPDGGGDQGPKYLNTPQTPIFDKGGVLYGLERAKEEIRASQTAVIVEGYMDVIAAHQHGYRNVVASMGTALTERQALLLQRFADKVVLAMDADEAGKAANLRAVQVVATAAERPRPGGALPRRLDIRVLALPQGKDPDELIRRDAAAWTAALATARPVVDHLIAVAGGALDLSEPRNRSQLVSEVLPVIGEVADPVLQAHYLQRLSRLARVSEDALRRELPSKTRRQAVRRREGPRERPSEEQPQVTQSRAPLAASPRKTQREEYCLALLLRLPELASRGKEIAEGLFSLSENRELFRRWRDGPPLSEEDGPLWDHYQDVLLTRLLAFETAQAEAALLDCVTRLEQVRMRAIKEASALALAEGEAGVRPGQVASIARAKLDINRHEEVPEDPETEVIASRLLEDMEAGLRFHRSLIDGSRYDQAMIALDREEQRG
jgi:DNA primase